MTQEQAYKIEKIMGQAIIAINGADNEFHRIGHKVSAFEKIQKVLEEPFTMPHDVTCKPLKEEDYD